MGEQLRRHLDELAALVARAAGARGLAAAYVEKDFWVTEVLRAAETTRTVRMSDGSTAPVRFLFKGGTSLSRVFGIVDRFSEDVDLLAVFPTGASATARHKVLKAIDADVRAHLGLTDSDVTVGASTTGIKRYTAYYYYYGHRARRCGQGRSPARAWQPRRHLPGRLPFLPLDSGRLRDR